MTPDFERAVGGMADIPQWFVWRLEWDAIEGKFQKTPCDLQGTVFKRDASDPAWWSDYDTVVAAVRALDAGSGELRYAMGFRLTEGCGYFLFDMDKCVTDGVATDFAKQMIAAFPGAMLEYSSSERGVHVLGMCSEIEHRSMCKEHNMEFYTENRGICFSLTGRAWGCADVNQDGPVTQLVERYFKPLPVREGGERDARWAGPVDDDELLRRAYKARSSAAVSFGGVAGVQALMEGPASQTSENDSRLASHLAWWTGRDVARIERIMRRSVLARPKWDEYRPQGGSYLMMTILHACAVVDTCYVEPQRDVSKVADLFASTAPISAIGTAIVTHNDGLVSQEQLDEKNRLLDMITGAATEFDMVNVVAKAISEAGVPKIFQRQIADAYHKQMKDAFSTKLAIADVRATLFPGVVKQSHDELPDWAKDWCFVGNGDMFFNLTNGQRLTFNGFHASFGHLMPMTDQGRRQNAAEQCLHFWGMEKVAQIGYRPDQDRYYDYEGVRYANTYSPTSLPAVAPYTQAGHDGIAAFQQHLMDMCSGRHELFYDLIYWMAYNVQFPGRKIRWSPIIKGCQGDGKTLITEVLGAAMGSRNINITGNATLTANGGFTDWATGAAVNFLEEIHLTGALRHQLYNAMKEFISNKKVNINPKGRTTYKTWNSTNHWASSNHNDAIPLETTDRRWLVIFTPWSDLAGLRAYCGLTPEAWQQRTDCIDYLYNYCAGELRAWFLSVAIPATFNVNGSARETPEREQMMASSQDDAESVARGIVEEGAWGISKDVLSSPCLMSLLKMRALQDNFDLPKTTGVGHMLKRMGFSKLPKQFKWQDRTHTIWIKDGFSGDVREFLDKTKGLGVKPTFNPHNLPEM